MADKKAKPKLPWWAIALIVIAIIIILNSGGNPDRYCVEECVSEMEFCASDSYIIAQSMVSYISEYDFESCQLDLESCIYDC